MDFVSHQSLYPVLYEPGDVEGMARGLIRLLRDDALRERFGAEGRRMIEERFTLERHIASLEEVYREAFFG